MIPSHKAPATKLLSNASRELRSLRIMIERLEAAAYVLLTKPEGDHTHELMEIQQLDHLMQTIMNIADFIDTITATIPDDIDMEEREAMKAINLHALAQRLATNVSALSSAHSGPVENEDSGECCFFEE